MNEFVIMVGNSYTNKSMLLLNIMDDIGIKDNMDFYICDDKNTSDKLFKNNYLQKKLIIFNNTYQHCDLSNNFAPLIKAMVSREKFAFR